ncbi:S1 family peptidase [Mycobacteroides abscessus]|uniref:S1 family peptidase n=1 Tax=Mycobacteroides abscessus TaxID=36809 RepID=UPI001F39DD38|nr:S1 family peptidase [Mycobacteroides abscessus]
MSRTRLGAAAAGIAAAVVLSACSTGVAGQPVADPMTSGATTAESAGPSTSVESNWLTIPAEQAAAAPKRIQLLQTAADGATARCTAGPAVAAAAAAAHRGYLAAGHCDEVPGSSLTAGGEAVAPYTGTRRGDRGVTVAWGATDATSTVAGHPVAGVLKQDVVQLLPQGTPVCMDSNVSGVRCGAVVENDATGIYLDLPAERGDSGAPLFLLDGQGRATLIGLAEQRSAGYTFGAHLDPLLAQMGAKALVDRTAAVDPAADPRYSSATTPQ